ncbi:MAG: FtsX-like permease family protein [Bacteroidetes bacterium]|nr:FtsX-like permease family protein [Bacteroidota bacterium]MCL2328965.1 FtsX-like permease family protein [Bacteroidota bacterium]
MKNILILSWKNIWRNKVRSAVIISAIAIGLFSGTFLLAFMNGWILGTVDSDIRTQYSHIQIHNTEFLANNDVGAYFMRDAVCRDAMHCVSTANDAKIAYRLNLNGMLASSHNALGITAKGVFPNEEIQVTDVWQHIPDTMGVFLTDDSRMPIVISSRTAEKLRVRLRSRIVFTFQDVNGDMQSLAFRVGGIYHTTNAMFDEATVFVRYTDILPYTALPEGAVHETAILFPNLEIADHKFPLIKALFPDFEVRDWRQLNPALAMYFSFTEFMGLIILGIFLFALSFGIINTMLMAVLERTRELGMLGAIGMSKRNIFSMIMLETVFLTLVGGVIGIILGIAVILPTMKTGIDLSFFMADQFEDFGFGSKVYPVFDIKMFTEIVVLVLIAGIVSAIYPARKALKMKPLDAMRT